MAKRVKPGYDELLPGQCRAREHGGRLRISQGPELNSWVALPVGACEALGITAALEDVPEPWERVRDAVRQAVLEVTPDAAHPGLHIPKVTLQRVAELLGIKPEGES